MPTKILLLIISIFFSLPSMAELGAFRIECSMGTEDIAFEYKPSVSKKTLFYGEGIKSKTLSKMQKFDFNSGGIITTPYERLILNYSLPKTLTGGDWHKLYKVSWMKGFKGMVSMTVSLNKDKTIIRNAKRAEPYNNCISIGIW